MDLRAVSKPTFTLISICAFMMLLFGAGQAQVRKPRSSQVRPKTQTARIEITKSGYQPASIRLRRGIAARITFLRTTDATCATQVVFPDYGIRRDLPLDQTVVVSITPRNAGEFAFACGMNMMRGKLIVR